MESGWAQEIIADLSKVHRGGVEIGVRAAFDDLLSSLVASGGPDVIEEFQKCGAIQVCQAHTLVAYSQITILSFFSFGI